MLPDDVLLEVSVVVPLAAEADFARREEDLAVHVAAPPGGEKGLPEHSGKVGLSQDGKKIVSRRVWFWFGVRRV